MEEIFFKTLLMAMTPVVELRGAIPYGLAMDLSPTATFLASVVGNCIPVPFIILFIEHIFAWMRRRSQWLSEKVDWLENRAAEKSDVVQKYALAGLVILVAIPLPGTGAWTGTRQRNAHKQHQRHKQTAPAGFSHQLLTGVLSLDQEEGAGLADVFLAGTPGQEFTGKEINQRHRQHIADGADNDGPNGIQPHADGHGNRQTQFHQRQHGYKKDSQKFSRHNITFSKI